jgi:hypothetical protein
VQTNGALPLIAIKKNLPKGLTMKERILSLIQQTSYLTAGEIAEHLSEDVQTVERQLSHLLVSGKVKQFNRQYRINYEGKAAIPRRMPMQGVYNGNELKPYIGRPGAMDAFSLPSMSAGKRIPRSAPVGMLAKKHPAEAR